MKRIIVTILLLLCSTALPAQEPAVVRRVVLPNLDAQVRARLVALDARLNPAHSPTLAVSLTTHLAGAWSPLGAIAPVLADAHNNEVWEQLVDDYSRLAVESGDALVTMQETSAPGAAWTSTQVRRLSQQRLASLPRSVVDYYRQRVEAEARALYEDGRAKRSAATLRRVADELYSSRYGPAAIDLLGDIRFERGDFEEARYWWSQIAAGKNGQTFLLDPQIDAARTQAKQILALIFQGRLNEADAEINAFAKRNPSAAGAFAGENGVYHATLRKTLAAFARARIVNNNEPWTTFGGDASRQRTLSQALSWHQFEEGPAWRVPLPPLVAGNNAAPARPSLVRGLAFHPIIVNDQVLIADHRSVISYQLATGKELFRYDLKNAGLRDPGPGVDAKILLPRFTLSADHERAYMRLGGLRIGPDKKRARADASYLVCLDLTDPSRDKKRELWHIEALTDEKAPAWFEGSPLVFDGRVYAVHSRMVERRIISSIQCCDVLGRRRWSREVCDAPEFESVEGPRTRHHLLTLAGGQVVYANHAGAVVAVDAWTGQPTWAVRYPSRRASTGDVAGSSGEPAPALYADGQVYVAPEDSDRVLCMDATSGQVKWEADAVDVVHLLGVAHGKLLTATRNGLQAFDISSGRTQWLQPSAGRLPSMGRGLLAGNWLFWPTQDPLLPYRAVTLQEGNQEKAVRARSVLAEPARYYPTLLTSLPPGNWALGQGCLAIAGASELVVYVPPRQPKGLMDPRLHARLGVR